jgi:hypothetical protein
MGRVRQGRVPLASDPTPPYFLSTDKTILLARLRYGVECYPVHHPPQASESERLAHLLLEITPICYYSGLAIVKIDRLPIDLP